MGKHAENGEVHKKAEGSMPSLVGEGSDSRSLQNSLVRMLKVKVRLNLKKKVEEAYF